MAFYAASIRPWKLFERTQLEIVHMTVASLLSKATGGRGWNSRQETRAERCSAWTGKSARRHTALLAATSFLPSHLNLDNIPLRS
jgi:hypothetical protein